jgi:hypothetical protein
MNNISILFPIMLLFAFCGTEENSNSNEGNETSEPKYEANYTSESGMFKCYFPESFVPEETFKQLEGEDGIIELHSFNIRQRIFILPLSMPIIQSKQWKNTLCAK